MLCALQAHTGVTYRLGILPQSNGLHPGVDKPSIVMLLSFYAMYTSIPFRNGPA